METVYKTANKRIDCKYNKPSQDWGYKKVTKYIILDFSLIQYHKLMPLRDADLEYRSASRLLQSILLDFLHNIHLVMYSLSQL